jgi:two-component system, cell cycle response regulator DivK
MKDKRHLILVIEPDQTTYKILFKLLDRYGCDVARAESGEEAINLIVQEKPDMVLFDLRLPDMNGMELPHIVYKNEQFLDLPLIAMSNFCTEDTQNSAIEAGCLACIPKPVTTREIEQMLVDFLPSLNIPTHNLRQYV